jgi:hypothetical protein
MIEKLGGSILVPAGNGYCLPGPLKRNPGGTAYRHPEHASSGALKKTCQGPIA